jgi:hypothetical protein
LAVTRYDQYGDVIKKRDNMTADELSRIKWDAVITPFHFDSLTFLKPENAGYDYDKVVISLAKGVEKAAEHTVNVFVGSASATATVSVKSSKVATKVEFDTFSGVIAEGDGVKYLPFIAYDADGNKLTAQEIVDQAKLNRFSISVSGAILNADGNDSNGNDLTNGNAAIVQNGEHKGKIKLDSITATERGVVFANLGIYTANTQSNVQQSLQVQAPRKPVTVVLDGSDAPHKAIAGGASKIKWFVKDQYDAELGSTNTSKVPAADYKVKVTVTGSTYATFGGLTGGSTVGDVTTFEYDASQFASFNKKELSLTAQSTLGKAKVTAELIKTTGTEVLKKVENEVEVINNNTELTYAVKALGDIFAARDHTLTPADDKELVDGDDAGTTFAYDSKFAKAIEITAKNKAGDTVAIPANRVSSISSSDNNVANAIQVGNAAKVIGFKAGKATITVVYNAFDGTTKEAAVEVNVKSDLVVPASASADANVTFDRSVNAAAETPITDIVKLVNLKVKDNYGTEYSSVADINKYKAFLGVQYVVSDIQGTGNKTVTVNSDGTFSFGAGVTEFVLKAIAGGKTTSTLVVVQD